MNYYLTNFDLIRTEKSLKTNNIDYSLFTKLTDEQINWFVKGSTPEGKQRKSWTLELEDIPEPTGSELAQIAQSEMITELNWCDLQIKLHASSDKRAVSTLDDIYAYARACRDYVQNVDGELTIMTDKPVRPS